MRRSGFNLGASEWITVKSLTFGVRAYILVIMKRIPSSFLWLLVEKVLDQPSPTKELRDTLQLVLEHGEHPDRRTL